MSKRVGLAFGVVLAAAGAARAGDFDAPLYAPGDAWIYDTTNLKNGVSHDAEIEISVSRLQGERMIVSVKPVGSTKPPVDRLVPLDWSRPRSVNGVETLVNRPLSFPLALGKTWRVEYSEANPNVAHVKEQYTSVYKVVDWETIKTGAKEYKALKIEANGDWNAESAPRIVSNSTVGPGPNGAPAARVEKNVIAAQHTTGRFYRVFYYVPAVKRWVKELEEFYDTNGAVSSSYTEELKDFHAAGS